MNGYNRPLISIVTPSYNRAAFLGTAIESVLAQTYQNFEHIIIDDGSTDATPQLMEKYLGDSRVRYYFQRENQGQSAARNAGIEKCRGEFICFLDSDNAWFANKLEQQVRVFNEIPEIGVVYGDNVTIDETGREISRKNMKRHSGMITAKLLVDNFISMNTTMTRSVLIKELGGFRVSDGLAEDYGLWLRLSTLTKFKYIPEYWGYYRIMGGQLSDSKIARLLDNEKLIVSFLKSSQSQQLTQPEIRSNLALFYCRKARSESHSGYAMDAAVSSWKALRYAPLSFAVWRTLARTTLNIAKG